MPMRAASPTQWRGNSNTFTFFTVICSRPGGVIKLFRWTIPSIPGSLAIEPCGDWQYCMPCRATTGGALIAAYTPLFVVNAEVHSG